MFKGYKMLISGTLYAIVWTGCFDPFGETWNSMHLFIICISETNPGSFIGNGESRLGGKPLKIG